MVVAVIADRDLCHSGGPHGQLFDSVYSKETANWAAQGFAQDIVNVFIAYPAPRHPTPHACERRRPAEHLHSKSCVSLRSGPHLVHIPSQNVDHERETTTSENLVGPAEKL